MNSSLNVRLQHRLLVTELLDEFTFRSDQGESVADLFHEEAVFETPKGQIKGREAIASHFLSSSQTRAQAGRRSRHATFNVRIREIVSGLEVSSSLLALAIEPGEGGNAILWGDQQDIVAMSASGSMQFMHRRMTPALTLSTGAK